MNSINSKLDTSVTLQSDESPVKLASCAVTGDAICRRMYNINLALGYTEEFYSLAALAEMHDRSLEEMFDFGFEYVQARECFSKEWAKMTQRHECPLPNSCLIDKCFDEKI